MVPIVHYVSPGQNVFFKSTNSKSYLIIPMRCTCWHLRRLQAHSMFPSQQVPKVQKTCTDAPGRLPVVFFPRQTKLGIQVNFPRVSNGGYCEGYLKGWKDSGWQRRGEGQSLHIVDPPHTHLHRYTHYCTLSSSLGSLWGLMLRKT